VDNNFNRNLRPVFGQVNFNVAKFSYSDEDFEKQVDTAVHEITHVLAFSTSLFPFYINPATNSKIGASNVA
jgi:hypothetical protein